MNFEKFLGIAFFKEHLLWLLLENCKISTKLRIRKSRQFFFSFQEVFKITVLDANDKPTAIQATIIPIPENTQVDYKLAELKVIDEDKSQNHSCICISSNKDWVHFVNENNGNTSIYLTKNQVIVNYEETNEIKCT